MKGNIEAKIIGVWLYEDKFEKNQKMGVVFGYDSNKKKYTGLTPAKAYFDYDKTKFEILEDMAVNYVNEVEDTRKAIITFMANIETGKNKCVDIEIKYSNDKEINNFLDSNNFILDSKNLDLENEEEEE